MLKKYEQFDNDLDPYGEENWNDKEFEVDDITIYPHLIYSTTVFTLYGRIKEKDLAFKVIFDDDGYSHWELRESIDDVEIEEFLDEHYNEVGDMLINFCR
jgi:hypothetical protein